MIIHISTDSGEIEAEEYFKNFKNKDAKETNNPISGYTFDFEGDKCIKINLQITGC